MEYIGFRLLLFKFRLLPDKWRKALLRFLFLVFGYGLGIRRKVANIQLKRVFPDLDKARLKQILKGVYRNMADSVYEVYLLKDKDLLNRCIFLNYECMEEALALGRGVILATAHFGSWESARVMPMKGVPLCVVTKRQRNVKFDDYTNRIRTRNGLIVLDMRRGLRDLIHHLHANRVVAILVDQNAGGSGLQMDFMGYSASHWKGVAKLALRYKVPIVAGFAPRKDNNLIDFQFYPMILHEELEDKEENYPIVLNELNAILEGNIRKQLEQWFWVHKRWKGGFDMFSDDKPEPGNSQTKERE